MVESYWGTKMHKIVSVLVLVAICGTDNTRENKMNEYNANDVFFPETTCNLHGIKKANGTCDCDSWDMGGWYIHLSN